MHRVGRTARAGKSGTALSILAHDEVAHLLDLFKFLVCIVLSSATFRRPAMNLLVILACPRANITEIIIDLSTHILSLCMCVCVCVCIP